MNIQCQWDFIMGKNLAVNTAQPRDGTKPNKPTQCAYSQLEKPVFRFLVSMT